MTQPPIPAPLPTKATDLVGQQVLWQEDKVIVAEGEATTRFTEDIALVLGARWARNVDGKPVGQDQGLVQFLMERPDGTTRWSSPKQVQA